MPWRQSFKTYPQTHISILTLPSVNQNLTTGEVSRIYIQKIENSKVADIENQLNQAYANFNPDLAEDELYKSYFLQPIAGTHLSSNIPYELKTPGNKKYITLIGFFALFIIIITLFNYANLSLAIKSKQSYWRTKSDGSEGNYHCFADYFKGILLAFISLPVVALLIWVLVPYFNNLMGVSLNANLLVELVCCFC